MRLFFLALSVFFSWSAQAGNVSGIVTDELGKPLAYASIIIKGSTKGTTANNEGRYVIALEPGSYTISCQYVGYEKMDKKVTVTDEAITVNFQLNRQQLSLAEVVVKPGAEDPAYEIIRNAIKKRPYYLNQLDKFQCEVYTKGQLRLRDFPKKFFGQKVDFEDGDTSKKKVLYLSESVARYSVKKPNQSKIEVLSTKVSGQSDGFGFSAPQVISFYNNNIQIGRNLNPRGFISPIANNALNYYTYKYEGSFFEDGKEINRIKVIPKRKYEPLFSGYINITENDWRIHSVQLQLTKQSQMQLVDTLKIEQLFVPYDDAVWVIKTQVIYPSVKVFGFDAYGSFANVYSKFDVNPLYAAGFFNNTFLKYENGSNKKPSQYWDTIRPVALQADEVLDYHKKDSLELLRKDPHYLDSLDKKRNKLTVAGVVLFGQTISKEKKKTNINISPLIEAVSFNTVEGWVLNPKITVTKKLDSTNPRESIVFTPAMRYGFSNKHFNAYAGLSYNYGKKYFSSINLYGGKRVYQFNNNNPIGPLINTIYTLLSERNYMKLYEAWTARIRYTKGLGEGLTLITSFNYQDRLPLENTTGYSWKNFPDRNFTPNFPTDLLTENFKRHQAAIFSITANWRPGARYIEFPDRKVNIGSKYPNLSLTITEGVKNFLGSDVDYGKWRLSVSDNANLKLLGTLRYNVSGGGFYKNNAVQVQDYKHFNGNQVILAGNYLSSFQLLPYYLYSNTATLYAEAHAEHHFNGLLTNKIPLLRSLNWHLVAGANSFYINKQTQYTEAFFGLENIFRLIRIDMIWGFEYGRAARTGIRIGITGVSNGGNDDSD